MNCKNCGTPLEDGQKFCMNCGTKVEPAAVEPAVVEPVAPEPAAVEPAVVEPAVVEPAAVEPEAPKPVMEQAPEVKYEAPKQETPVAAPYQPQQNPVYAQPVADKSASKGFAITSMVCGIVACVCCCSIVPGAAYILPIVAIVFGILTLVQGRGGRGMAIAGLILGGIALLMAIGVSSSGVLDDSADAIEDILEDVDPGLDLYDNILDEIL